MKRMIGLMSFVVAVLGSTVINKECKMTMAGSEISCRCIGREEFQFPGNVSDYKNATCLRIQNCQNAYLHEKNLESATNIREIIVENIDTLRFDLIPRSNMFMDIKLSNIHWIPILAKQTFLFAKKINSLTIENARIGELEDIFSGNLMTNVYLTNVTVDHAEKLYFSEDGGNILHMVDSEFQNIRNTRNFANFSNVEIKRSKFNLNNPGNLDVNADEVFVEDCVFSNTTIIIKAQNSVSVKGICASGKSSMGLYSNKIMSMNNRLPNQINYLKDAKFSDQNNTICIAGNCKCSKTSGQDTFATTIASSFAYRFLISTSILMSMRLKSF